MEKDLLAAAQSFALSLQTRYWPPSISDVLQFLLVIATGLTVYWLWRYTKETEQLRIATRDQVNVSNQLFEKSKQQVDAELQLLRETQLQTEHSVMPMVVLTTGRWENNVTVFFVENMGKGPALNTNIGQFTHDGSAKFYFGHRTAIAPGEKHVAWYGEVGSAAVASPGNMVVILKQQDALKEVPLCISYKGINGKTYRTEHTIMLTDRQDDLRITFGRFHNG